MSEGRNSSAKGQDGADLEIVRVFDAPRELVFAAWTQPEHLSHWQGAPRGFTVTTEESDIRPGGGFRITMKSPEGEVQRLQGHYREIIPPARIVFTHNWIGADNKPGTETLVTVALAERGGKTELTLRQTGFDSAGARDGHAQGWNSALGVLADYLVRLHGNAA